VPERGRILVVEDDPAVRQVLVDSLRFEEYDVREAPDGRAALDVLDGWRPDLILLDLMMPRMDGWQFRAAQLARADARDVPVVIVSAARAIDERREELQPAAVVPKPFDLDQVLDLVEHLVAGRAA
jgi:two-component system response regulator MprA